ncbi:MAG: DEAD/DEAH box helicase family protein [Blautia faecis]
MKTTGLMCLGKGRKLLPGQLVPGSGWLCTDIDERKEAGSFPADYFNTIIIDEAHHCISDSYQRVLQHFPEAQVLGVTATPDRGDMRNLAYILNPWFMSTPFLRQSRKDTCPRSRR